MCTILVITNNKGGCGKTTTAANLGAALRAGGFRVLLVDLDGQMNLTYCAGVTPQGRTVYDGMQGKGVTPCEIPGDGKGALHLLPGCVDMSAFEVEAATAPDRVKRCASMVEAFRPVYDYIIIDTPPSLGLITINALYAADAVIIPTRAEYLSIRGLLAIRSSLAQVAKYRGKDIPTKALFTEYDKRKSLHRKTAEQVEAAGIAAFPTKIRPNVALAECAAVGKDVFRYAPGSNGANDYAAFAADVAMWCYNLNK